MTYQAPLIPKSFIWRRLHSLTGLWLVLFLIEHLLVNSQAALFVGEDGTGFISGVATIRSLPYLPVVEVIFLGIPFLIHGWWGVKYLFSAKYNSFSTDGSSPALPEYSRNRAYTWQRITSWFLLIAIAAHVWQMRFLENPSSARMGTQWHYMVPVEEDAGLGTLSHRLGVELYTKDKILALKQKPTLSKGVSEAVATQEEQEYHSWIAALEQRPLQTGQVMAISPDFGTAELLMVRETFKEPIMIAFYTLLVLASCFHAFNGLWTFMISWGITLTERSQWWMRKLATGLMVLVSFLGLAAIWGTYWINLRT